MRTLLLTIARLSAAAWVGAAALFVVTAVREVTNPQFDLPTKDMLVLLRFPAYYVFGLTLVPVALVASLFACRRLGRPEGSESPSTVEPAPAPAPAPARRSCWPTRLASGLLAIALAIMIADYFAVYTPMVEMITPPGKTRVAEFQSYHRASMWLNFGDVGLCALAAALLCWPQRGRPDAGTFSKS